MFKSTYGTMYYVNDMKRAVNQYKSKFGLNPTHESDGWTEFSVGGHNICLHAVAQGQQSNGKGILIFNFDGVKDLYEKMGREGIKVSSLHEVHPGASTFHMYDDDGNEFSVYGRP